MEKREPSCTVGENVNWYSHDGCIFYGQCDSLLLFHGVFTSACFHLWRIHGILQARILEWVAMPSSRGSSRLRDQPAFLMSPALAGRLFTTSATWTWVYKYLFECMRAKSFQSCPTLCDPKRTVACHVPLSMVFSRQEYWSGLLFPPLGDLPDPGIEPSSFTSPTAFTTSATWEAPSIWVTAFNSFGHIYTQKWNFWIIHSFHE